MSTYIITPSSDQEERVKTFLESLDVPFIKDDETLPDFVLEGIAQGEEDIKAGRFITHEEFVKRMKSAK